MLSRYHALADQCREAVDGKVWLSYNDPNYLKQRFSLSDALVKNIDVIAALINRMLS
jgi:hypothetical protein